MLTLERIRYFSREHKALHAALVRVIVGGERVAAVARTGRIDRKTLGRRVREFVRMGEGG